jgi:hypothetical protein
MRHLQKTTLLLGLGASALLLVSALTIGFAAWVYNGGTTVSPKTNETLGAAGTGVVTHTSTVTGTIAVSGNAVAIIDSTGYTTDASSVRTYQAVAFWADAKQDYSSNSNEIVAPTMKAVLTLSDTSAEVPLGTQFTYDIAISKTNSSLGYLLDYVNDFTSTGLLWASGVSIASTLPALTIISSAVPQTLGEYNAMIEALDNTIITFTFRVTGPTA